MLTRVSLQPADTLLSQINKGHGPTGSMPHRLKVLAQEAGFKGLFAGLGPRMIMTAGLVAGQFLMYGAIKDGQFSYTPGFVLTFLIHARFPFQPLVRLRAWKFTRRTGSLPDFVLAAGLPARTVCCKIPGYSRQETPPLHSSPH